MIEDLILKNRSYRRFYENENINTEILKGFINLARLSPSGRNLQPLKYIISNTSESNKKIFPTLAWAGYLSTWDGPKEGERPTAYIIVLIDTTITKSKPAHDEGIVAQSILLGATEKGYGGCIIQSVKTEELSKSLNIPPQYKVALVIALGKPKESIVICDVKDEDIKYFRDSQDIHYVPKRNIEDIIIKII